jgi:hypothetical protein
MPSAAYFRRQADICIRLSLIASDDGVSNRLITMAREYMASSEALDREKRAGPASIDPTSIGDQRMGDQRLADPSMGDQSAPDGEVGRKAADAGGELDIS